MEKRELQLFIILVILLATAALAASFQYTSTLKSPEVAVEKPKPKLAQPVQKPVKEKIVKELYSYKSMGVYYYYVSDFSLDTFRKKPANVQPVNFSYEIFIYDKDIPKEKLTHRDIYDIEDDAGYYFDMIMVGIENKPVAYIRRTMSSGDEVKVAACLFKPGNTQVRYLFNPETGEFVKQVEFNNGELGIVSICNPLHVPWHDI